MKDSDRMTCLEVLATFAWADGEVDGAERKRIHNFLAGAADLQESEIERLLGSAREPTVELLTRVGSLSPESVCELLAVADAMCYADHSPSAGETRLLQQIGIAKFGDDAGRLVLGWLGHQRQANALLDELLQQ